jgi:bifunctional DNA-binding transcriptional regulator/antitoxin component of YhaV-PrlF toxin-antitoxin module
VTIPAETRRLLGVSPHDRVEFVVAGKVPIAPATRVIARIAGMRKGNEPTLNPREGKAAEEEEMAEEAAHQPLVSLIAITSSVWCGSG